MRRILEIFFLVVPSLLFAQSKQDINPNGYNKFYYDNGKLSSEGPMRDGKPDGYWKTYSMSGTLKSEGNRKNFQLDSVWKFYSEQGRLAFEFNYKDGKKTGLKKTFDTRDGFLIMAENYDADVKQGNTIVYYKPAKQPDSTYAKTGKVKQIIPFVAGKEEGQGYELSPDSTIITLTQYKMGFIQREERINRKDANGLKQGMWKEFYPSGIVKNEVNYSDDKMNGYLKEYAPNGSLSNTTKYINGVVQTNAPELAKLDVKSTYYENGMVKFTGTYKDGVAEGIHREFNEKGQVIAAKVYIDGVLTGEGILDTAGRQQGPWKEYHPNGELKSQGEYLNGKRIGDWVFYHPNKKVEQKGKYDKKGRAQGPWKWYYESGNLLREENYRNDLQDGTMTEYSDSGKVITKGDYIDGLKEGPWMLELADYREEGNYKADLRDGEWKHYYTKNGNLRFVGKFIEGVPDGEHKYYYENGKEKQTGKYVGGMKEGEWKFYDENGFLFLTILFRNDIEIKFDGIKVVPETSDSEPSIK
jgi:antitoxin component YwqK of YwqJK toxin-antitoxin module